MDADDNFGGWFGDDDSHHPKEDDDGFTNYKPATIDPGPWVLISTFICCFSAMVIVVPILVRVQVRRRRQLQSMRQKEQQEHRPTKEQPNSSSFSVSSDSTTSTESTSSSSWNENKLAKSQYDKETLKMMRIKSEQKREKRRQARQERMKRKKGKGVILRCDQEMWAILSRAIPYGFSGLASACFSNVCLAMVGHFVGTKSVAAYVLVQILAGLTDGILYGPIGSCTSLCAQALGAGNSFLAGQYIQLALALYLLLYIPVVYFWWTHMGRVVLLLEWGDEETAALAQEFIRVYIWSYILEGVSSSMWQLLEVADHVTEGSIMSIVWGATNVLVISLLVTQRDTSLFDVGLAYIGTAVFFIFLTYLIAEIKGWLKPFRGGLFGSLAFCNWQAISLMIRQALPLSFGSIVSNAEWAVLTFFASRLGPAEVAAWAILGSIWDLFYSLTSSIGDAAEIRVAYHLGQNDTFRARLAAYKSLLLSMCVATVVSFVHFTLQYEIPAWYTVDNTLRAMLQKLVPFVGIGNLTMQFGCTSWSIIGAMGKYKLATWVSFISSWGITMPLAAMVTIWLRMDLQGLTAAVVWGYVCTGASLSFVLLSTDWNSVAEDIQKANASYEESPTQENEAPATPPQDLMAGVDNKGRTDDANSVVESDGGVLYSNTDGSLVDANHLEDGYTRCFSCCGSIEVDRIDAEEMAQYWNMENNSVPVEEDSDVDGTTLRIPSAATARNTRLFNLAPRSGATQLRRWHQRTANPRWRKQWKSHS